MVNNTWIILLKSTSLLQCNLSILITYCYIIVCVAVVLDPEYKIALACWTGEWSFDQGQITKKKYIYIYLMQRKTIWNKKNKLNWIKLNTNKIKIVGWGLCLTGLRSKQLVYCPMIFQVSSDCSWVNWGSLCDGHHSSRCGRLHPTEEH